MSNDRCTFRYEGHRCVHPARFTFPARFGQGETPVRYCRFHAVWALRDGEPDPYYHRKVVTGLITPTLEYIRQAELNALFGGRRHWDGRRTDLWVIEDPVPVSVVVPFADDWDA
jgi:hypothetical protein